MDEQRVSRGVEHDKTTCFHLPQRNECRFQLFGGPTGRFDAADFSVGKNFANNIGFATLNNWNVFELGSILNYIILGWSANQEKVRDTADQCRNGRHALL